MLGIKTAGSKKVLHDGNSRFPIPKFVLKGLSFRVLAKPVKYFQRLNKSGQVRWSSGAFIVPLAKVSLLD